MQVPNFRFTNNLVKHNTYGIMGDARGYGTDTLNAYFPGAVIERNTFAGGSSSRYPSGNEFPTVTYWQGQFVNFAASDFRLIDSQPVPVERDRRVGSRAPRWPRSWPTPPRR